MTKSCNPSQKLSQKPVYLSNLRSFLGYEEL
jgi:hypothetical protein